MLRIGFRATAGLAFGLSLWLLFSGFAPTVKSQAQDVVTEGSPETSSTTTPLIIALGQTGDPSIDDELNLLNASRAITTQTTEQTTTTQDQQASSTEPDAAESDEAESNSEKGSTTKPDATSSTQPSSNSSTQPDTTSSTGSGASTTQATTTTRPTTTSTQPATTGPTGPDTDSLTFFVSPSGNDSNDGQSSQSPWRDLQKALDRLNPGQTLYLMSGTYDGNSQYAVPPAHWVVRRSGTSNAWIRVAAAPGHRPVLQPTKGHAIEILNSRYVEVSGLTIIGKGFAKDVNDYGWGVMVRNSSHVRVAHNEVTGMPYGGISAIESDRFELVGNRVHHNSYWGPGQGSGISIWRPRSHGTGSFGDGYHIRIVGNMSYSNENKVYAPKEWYPDRNVMSDGNGIIFDEGRHHGYSSRVLIANNLMFDNGGRGVNVTKSSNVDVVHNTTYHNGKTKTLSTPGTELSTTWSHNVRFLNNFSVSRPGLVEIMLSEAYGWTAKGNVFVTDNHNSKVSEGNHFVYSGPGFVNGSTSGNSDFKLTASSPALNRGVNTGASVVGTDRGGRKRDSNSPDAGAYER